MPKLCLILLIFLSVSQVHAYQIEWVRHSLFGPEQIVIKYDDKKSLLFTNTSAFNNKNPVSVGYFEKAADLTRVQKIEELLNDPKQSDRKQKNSTSPHVAKIYVDGKEIPFGSKVYSDFLKFIEFEVNSPSWKFVEGQKVNFRERKDLEIADWKTKKHLTSRTRKPASVCKTQGDRAACVLSSGVFYYPSNIKFSPFTQGLSK